MNLKPTDFFPLSPPLLSGVSLRSKGLGMRLSLCMILEVINTGVEWVQDQDYHMTRAMWV